MPGTTEPRSRRGTQRDMTTRWRPRPARRAATGVRIRTYARGRARSRRRERRLPSPGVSHLLPASETPNSSGHDVGGAAAVASGPARPSRECSQLPASAQHDLNAPRATSERRCKCQTPRTRPLPGRPPVGQPCELAVVVRTEPEATVVDGRWRARPAERSAADRRARRDPAHGPRPIAIDLTETTFMDSAGIHVLVNARQRARAASRGHLRSRSRGEGARAARPHRDAERRVEPRRVQAAQGRVLNEVRQPDTPSFGACPRGDHSGRECGADDRNRRSPDAWPLTAAAGPDSACAEHAPGAGGDGGHGHRRARCPHRPEADARSSTTSSASTR